MASNMYAKRKHHCAVVIATVKTVVVLRSLLTLSMEERGGGVVRITGPKTFLARRKEEKESFRDASG